MKKHIPVLFCLFLLSCNDTSNNSEAVNDLEVSSVIAPPLQGNFSNQNIFTIEPNQENKLETPNGSYFTIPANALVDKEGNQIETPVEITFDQFHSLPDILASGIPMSYDTLGEDFTFQSAGMFSLNGTSNGNPVYLKDGENIEMNLASDKNSDSPYNFYSLNENTGDWTYEHSNSPVRGNPRFDPENYTPPRPEAVSEDAFVLDINFDLSNYAELAIFSGIVWEYTGTTDSLDPRKNTYVNNTKWTDFDLEPTHEKAYEYYLTMRNPKTSFTTKVKAALDGENLELALEEFKQKKTEIAKKIDDLQKPYIRSVNIAGFGTYNYDYIYKIEAPAQMVADFDFGKHNSEKEDAIVAVVYEEDEVVVNYPKDKWKIFGLNTEAEAKIIAILPGNQIAVCRDDVSGSYGKEQHTFKMHVLDDEIDSKDQLIDVLASL